jgi:hypothetical protein
LCKRYLNKAADEVKILFLRYYGFTSIEIAPSLVDDQPLLFAEGGSIKLYEEATAE